MPLLAISVKGAFRSAPLLTSQEALATAPEKEFWKSMRLLRVKRITPPNCTVCAPLVQVRSSLMVWTGIMAVKFWVCATVGSTPRKVTMPKVCSPVLSDPCRVRP